MASKIRHRFSEKFILNLIALLLGAIIILGYLRIIDSTTVACSLASLIGLVGGILLGKAFSA